MTIRFSSRRKLLFRAAACAFGLPRTGAAASPERARAALVVGNADYDRLPLRNAVHDARAMGTALAQCGFEVDARENLGWDSFVNALDDFTRRASTRGARLFYYAGHGMQIDGRSYLNPIGPMPANEHELRSRAIEVDPLIAQLSRLREGVSIMIVDACRSNPFLGALRHTRGLAAAAGIGPLEAPHGTLLAFATSSDGNAQDGSTSQSNGAFTRRLLQQLTMPGVPIEDIFKRVRDEVDNDTGHAQRPWVSTDLVGDFCLRESSDGRCGRSPR
jgi:uncharacterized caspase-like protein